MAEYLNRVAAWLAEEEERKRAAMPPSEEGTDRVFTTTRRGVHSYMQTPGGMMGGEEETDDPTGEEARSLRSQGYRWLPQEDYDLAISQAHRAMDGAAQPPPGKLPFISGTPTHAATKPGFAYMPTVANPAMAGAMAGAAEGTKTITGEGRFMLPPGAQAPKKDPLAVLARAKGRRGVSVRSTKEGVQPQFRAPVEPLAARAAPPALPPRVSAMMEARRGPSGLEPAQQRANINRLAANLSQAGEFIGAGIAGVRPRPEAYDNLQAQADQPVSDYQQRAAEERQQEQDELALAEAEREATRAAEEMGFRRERATAEDQLARDRLAQEERIAGKRLEGEEADRAQRRAEFRYRKKEGESLKERLAEARKTERQAREDELDLQRLGTATSRAPFGEFQAALEEIDRLVPGIAYGQAPEEPPLGLGDRAARALPFGAGDWLMSERGRSYATAIANLRDLVARMRSGAVLNAGEERHYLSLLGDRALSDPRSAAQGINAVRQGIAQKLRNAQAGYQNVLPSFESTGATTYRAPIFGAAPTGEEIQMPDGSVYEVLSDGTTRRRP